MAEALQGRGNSWDGGHRGLWVSLGRAFGGALIFSLPMLMTMEMWQLGFSIDRWRLLGLLVLSWPLLMFISHYSGFEQTWGWREDARDVAIAFGVGIVSSTLVLGVLALISPGHSASEVLGHIGLQSIAAALGALLGRSQLGRTTRADREAAQDGKRETYGGEIVVMATGALFLSLNLAPTEEMIVISYRMTAAHTLLLIPASMLVMHAFVYASAFKGGSQHGPRTPWWSAFARFTVVGYAVALAMSCYVLWTFGRFDGMGVESALQVAVVLAFPSAVGAAAARLIL